MSKHKYTGYLLALVAFVVLLWLDQWTKQLAVTHLMNQSDVFLIPGVLQLHYLENTGAAFSLLENKMWLFYIFTPILCGAILYLFLRLPNKKEYHILRVILVLLMAGALGNYIDRIQYQYVIDFIYVSLIHFPVFNVADIYVTCSVIVLFLLILFVYSDEQWNEIVSCLKWTAKQEKNRF